MPKNLQSEYDLLIGKNIRALRKARRKSQEDVANAVGVSYQQVQKYESGNSRISVAALMKIADYLGVSLTECLPQPIYPSIQEFSVDSDTQKLLNHWNSITDPRIKDGFMALLESLADQAPETQVEQILKKRRSRKKA